MLALDYLTNIPVTLLNIAIFVDSKSVLCALESFNTETRPDLVIEINHLTHCLRMKGTNITFCWVPSHAGLSGNELVDKAAKRGAENSEKSSKMCIYPSVKEAYSSLKLTTWDRFLKRSNMKLTPQTKITSSIYSLGGKLFAVSDLMLLKQNFVNV